MSFRHGDARYRRQGCRCDQCTADHAQVHYFECLDRESRLAANFTRLPHGSESTYTNWRCRCGDCVEAQRVRNAEYYARHKGRIA